MCEDRGNDMFKQEGEIDEEGNNERGNDRNEGHEGDSSVAEKDAGYERLLE